MKNSYVYTLKLAIAFLLFPVLYWRWGGGSMLQNQEEAAGLTHLANSICDQCPMSETCGDMPMCGDIQLLKKAEKLLKGS